MKRRNKPVVGGGGSPKKKMGRKTKSGIRRGLSTPSKKISKRDKSLVEENGTPKRTTRSKSDMNVGASSSPSSKISSKMDERFLCPIPSCPFNSYQRNNLKSHLQRSHKEVDPEKVMPPRPPKGRPSLKWESECLRNQSLPKIQVPEETVTQVVNSTRIITDSVPTQQAPATKDTKTVARDKRERKVLLSPDGPRSYKCPLGNCSYCPSTWFKLKLHLLRRHKIANPSSLMPPPTPKGRPSVKKSETGQTSKRKLIKSLPKKEDNKKVLQKKGEGSFNCPLDNCSYAPSRWFKLKLHLLRRHKISNPLNLMPPRPPQGRPPVKKSEDGQTPKRKKSQAKTKVLQQKTGRSFICPIDNCIYTPSHWYKLKLHLLRRHNISNPLKLMPPRPPRGRPSVKSEDCHTPNEKRSKSPPAPVVPKDLQQEDRRCFKCPLDNCSFALSSRFNLKLHLIRRHKISDPTDLMPPPPRIGRPLKRKLEDGQVPKGKRLKSEPKSTEDKQPKKVLTKPGPAIQMRCLVCSLSFRQGGREVEGSNSFEKFSTGVLNIEPVSEVISELKGLSVCPGCLNLTKEAVEKKDEMDQVEGKVRQLQVEILKEMRKLMGRVAEFSEEIRKIEEVVNQADVVSLVETLDENGKTERRKGKRLLRSLRDGIATVAWETEKYEGNLASKLCDNLEHDVKPEVASLTEEGIPVIGSTYSMDYTASSEVAIDHSVVSVKREVDADDARTSIHVAVYHSDGPAGNNGDPAGASQENCDATAPPITVDISEESEVNSHSPLESDAIDPDASKENGDATASPVIVDISEDPEVNSDSLAEKDLIAPDASQESMKIEIDPESLLSPEDSEEVPLADIVLDQFADELSTDPETSHEEPESPAPEAEVIINQFFDNKTEKKPRFDCQLCPASYAKKFRLKLHMFDKHDRMPSDDDDKSWRCRNCDKKCTETGLRNYLKSGQASPYTCSKTCGYFFNKKQPGKFTGHREEGFEEVWEDEQEEVEELIPSGEDLMPNVEDLVPSVEELISSGEAEGVEESIPSGEADGVEDLVPSGEANGVEELITSGEAGGVEESMPSGETEEVEEFIPSGEADGVEEWIPSGEADEVEELIPRGVAEGVEGVDALIPSGEADGVEESILSGETDGVDELIPSGEAEGVEESIPRGEANGVEELIPSGESEDVNDSANS